MKSIRIVLQPIAFILILILLFILKGMLHSEDNPTVIPLEIDTYSLAIHPGMGLVLLVSKKSDSLLIADLNTQSFVSTLSVGNKPHGVAVDPELSLALVTNRHDHTLSVIDLIKNEVISTLSVGKSPEGIAIHRENHLAFIAHSGEDMVSVIDLKTYGLIKTISVGEGPKEIDIDPDLNLALVTHEKKEEVSIIDLERYQVIGFLPVGKKPCAISVNPRTHQAVVVNEKDDSISLIDLQTWGISSIAMDKHPIDGVINPLDNRALVLSPKERSLVLIDLYSQNVVNRYPVNEGARAVAVDPFANMAVLIDNKTEDLTLIKLPNPVPEITSVDPERLFRGSVGERIVIEGNGFIKGSSVSLLLPDSQRPETHFIDNQTLEMQIQEGLLRNAGTYQVVVTNPSPDGGTSNPVILQILNPMPSITLLEPPKAMAGSEGLSLNIHGTGFFEDTTVSVNGKPMGFTLISQDRLQLQLEAKDLEAGGYLEVVTSNPSPGGGSSNPLRFTILNPVPMLASISPSSILFGSSDARLTLLGDHFVKTSLVHFNHHPVFTMYVSKTQLEVILPPDLMATPGSYPVQVINPAPGGGESEALMFTIKPSLEVRITSPADGEIINRTKTMVRGTIQSNTRDVGISVNGALAEIIEDQWIANNIPLIKGQNTIVATATDGYGNTTTKTVMVYVNESAQWVELTAPIRSGISPLPVSFSVSTYGMSPVSYQIDFDGDGVMDYTGTTSDGINHTYATVGIFYPKLIVTDDQGNTYSDTMAIMVLSKTEMDSLLKNKWNGMKWALSNRNLTVGLDFFLESSRETYGRAFHALIDELPQIVSEMQEIEMIYLKSEVAKYRIPRVHDIDSTLQKITYYIYFSKDADGIWRIDRF